MKHEAIIYIPLGKSEAKAIIKVNIIKEQQNSWDTGLYAVQGEVAKESKRREYHNQVKSRTYEA